MMGKECERTQACGLSEVERRKGKSMSCFGVAMVVVDVVLETESMRAKQKQMSKCSKRRWMERWIIKEQIKCPEVPKVVIGPRLAFPTREASDGSGR